MSGRRFFVMAGIGLVALALSACTSFTPVYGDRSGADGSAMRFNFAPPSTRLEQVILNRLAIAFPRPASASDPTLSVSVATSGTFTGMSNAIKVGAPSGTRVEASVRIVQGDTELFSATRFTDSAYQGGKLAPTDAASSAGAYETAARSTAESLRAAILAGYRPGMVSTPQR